MILCTTNHCGTSGFHSIGPSVESPSRSGVEFSSGAERDAIAREDLPPGEMALEWPPGIEFGLDACDESEIGFLGTAGGAFSK